MGQALHTHALVGLEAPALDLLAGLVAGQVADALAGDAAEVVVGLALGDRAVPVGQQEGLEALGAGVVRLLVPAPQQQVVPALVEDQRVLPHATTALLPLVFLAVHHPYLARTRNTHPSVRAVQALTVPSPLQAPGVGWGVEGRGIQETASAFLEFVF